MKPGQVVPVRLPRGTELRGVVLEPDLIELGSAGLMVDVGTELVVGGLRAVVKGFERRPRRAREGFWAGTTAGWQVRIAWMPPELRMPRSG